MSHGKRTSLRLAQVKWKTEMHNEKGGRGAECTAANGKTAAQHGQERRQPNGDALAQRRLLCEAMTQEICRMATARFLHLGEPDPELG